MYVDSSSAKKIIAVAAVIVIAASAVYVIYDFNGDSLDFQDRETRLIVTGSMDGDKHTDCDIETIPIHSLVMVKKLDSSEMDTLEIGDVIAFHYGGRLTVHRIIAIDDTDPDDIQFTTCGDIYTPGAGHDEKFDQSEVVGVVVGVSEWMGKIVNFAQNSTILLVMIIVIICVIISVVRDVYKMHQRNKA